MTDYYDSILVAMPVSLFGIAGVASAVGYSATAGASIGALVAATAMGHAMFVNTPGSETRRTTTTDRGRDDLTTG